MPRSIVIEDEAIPVMIKAYELEIEACDTIIDNAQKRKDAAKRMVTQLKGTPATSVSLPKSVQVFGNYTDLKSWPAKTKYILNHIGREMTVNEILNEIEKLEPIDRRKVQGNISSNVTTDTGKHYYKVEKTGQEHKYGLLEWKKDKPTE